MPAGEVVVVVCAGLGAAGAALLAASMGLLWAGAAVGLAMLGVMVVLLGVERGLLVVVLLDLPLQVDVHLRYDAAAADLGALGGLSVSLTTAAVAGLLVVRSWKRLTRVPGAAVEERDRAWLPFAVYAAAVAASWLIADDRSLALNWALLVVQTFALFVCLLDLLRDVPLLRLAVGLLLAGLLLEAAVMTVQWTTGSALGGRVDQDSLGLTTFRRVGGTVGSPNGAAAYVSLLLPVAAGVLVADAGRHLRWLAAAAFAAGCVALLTTFSRGGWLSFGFAMAILLAAGVRRRWISARSLAVVAVGVAALLVSVRGLLLARLLGEDAEAGESRLVLLRVAWRVIRDHPLTGVGANNFVVALRDFFTPEFGGDWLFVVHNDFLLVWAEAGLGALLAYLWFFGSTLRRAWRAAGSSHPLLAPLALGCAAGIAARIAHMQVDLFNARPQLQSLAVIAAVAIAADRLVRSAAAPPRSCRPSYRG